MKKDISQLEDIMELYLSAKKNPENPQQLTEYAIEYIMHREAGLPHRMTMQKMYYEIKKNYKK